MKTLLNFILSVVSKVVDEMWTYLNRNATPQVYKVLIPLPTITLNPIKHSTQGYVKYSRNSPSLVIKELKEKTVLNRILSPRHFIVGFHLFPLLPSAFTFYSQLGIGMRWHSRKCCNILQRVEGTL